MPGKNGADIQAQVAPLILLTKLHHLLGTAEGDMRANLGVPLCTTGCTECCHVPSVRYLEADFLASWMLGNPVLTKPMLDKCEEWLLRPKRQALEFNPKDQKGLLQAISEIRQEPCPFLNRDESRWRCTIYDGRPLVCRSIGTTILPPRSCKRQLGIGESTSHKAYIGGEIATGLRKIFSELLKIASPEKSAYGFLPALLYARLRGDKLVNLIDSGKVSLVRVIQASGIPAVAELEDMCQDESMTAIVDRTIPLVDSGGNLVVTAGR